MRRVRFSAAMSLVAYIAGPNGESDWIVMDPEIDFRTIMLEYTVEPFPAQRVSSKRGRQKGS